MHNLLDPQKNHMPANLKMYRTKLQVSFYEWKYIIYGNLMWMQNFKIWFFIISYDNFSLYTLTYFYRQQVQFWKSVTFLHCTFYWNWQLKPVDHSRFTKG